MKEQFFVGEPPEQVRIAIVVQRAEDICAHHGRGTTGSEVDAVITEVGSLVQQGLLDPATLPLRVKQHYSASHQR